ncbi:hypothetical protein HZ326_4911 [Fusarium oxysporum f. sp. albedinis]|nr:hypothetical protein HZ326_4911 [Fusarium oxysporum f. sp. albedinis]
MIQNKAANQAKENHHVVHVEHYKKAGENPSIAYAYADSSKRKYNKFEFLRFSDVITPRMTTDEAKAFLNRLSFHITNHFARNGPEHANDTGGEVGLAGYKIALNAWAFHSPHELVILARCHASCWLLVTRSPETSHFSLKQRRQADRTKSRRQDMFVKLRTQNAKGRDAHRPVSPDMFKSNDYMRFDLEHPRQAVSVRVSVQENSIKTGSARPTRGPRL